MILVGHAWYQSKQSILESKYTVISLTFYSSHIGALQNFVRCVGSKMEDYTMRRVSAEQVHTSFLPLGESHGQIPTRFCNFQHPRQRVEHSVFAEQVLAVTKNHPSTPVVVRDRRALAGARGPRVNPFSEYSRLQHRFDSKSSKHSLLPHHISDCGIYLYTKPLLYCSLFLLSFHTFGLFVLSGKIIRKRRNKNANV